MPSASSIASLAATLLLMASGPAAAALEVHRTERLRYDLAVGGPFAGVTVPTAVGTYAVGGVRFEVLGADAAIRVALEDDGGRIVAGRWMLTDASGDELGAADFCGSATFPSPAAARVLWVFPSPLMGPCPVDSTHGPAVSGHVKAEFLR